MTMTKKSNQLFWHWVGDWQIMFWLTISPLSFTDGYSSCRWAGRNTSLWSCFSLWSARKSKYIRIQRKIFELHLRGVLLVVVLSFSLLLLKSVTNLFKPWEILTHEWELSLLKDSILISSPYIYLVGNWLWLPIRAQFWCSLESNLLGQMIFHLLAKCTHDKTTGSVNCDNSSVSFVMKYCPTSTVVKNPASVKKFNHTILLW